MRCLELFAGAGGLAKGFSLAGFTHEAFLEWNQDACNTLRRNFPAERVHQVDIKAVDFNNYHDVDFIVGGPPCQPFSLGGKAKGHFDQRDMFPYAIKSIRDIKPKAFLFENVKGLLRDSFKDYFEYIILGLTYPGEINPNASFQDQLEYLRNIKYDQYTGTKYRVQFTLVNAADYGIPQRRERVIIVGIRDDLGLEWSFPKKTHSEDALLWDKFVSKEYWKKHKLEEPGTEQSSVMQGQKLQFKYRISPPDELPWVTIRDAISEGTNSPYESDREYRQGAKEYPGHTGSNFDEPSKTIKAGAHGVPGGENMRKFNDGSLRYFTIGEAKRIQTFPDDYEITGSWSEAMRQLGNAVPVALAYILAQQLAQTFKKSPA